MCREQKDDKLLKLMKMSDLDFYEEFLADASFEEQAEFFRKFPEFLEDETAKSDDAGKNDMDSKDMLKMAVNASQERV